ncbi:transposase [Actinocrinis puniceicyclus]|uniref:Transposase n=1 Tax=Actinocrinis puniceicyclus TaxID=977794 RepID=A0A8J7WWL4_9ACTN|nr:transposase [Actinocrinis puniceicyclus]
MPPRLACTIAIQAGRPSPSPTRSPTTPPSPRCHQPRQLTCALGWPNSGYTRLLGLDQHPDLAATTPDTLRFRLWHLPAKLAAHARRRVLKIPADWPWATAFTDCCNRLAALPDPG